MSTVINPDGSTYVGPPPGVGVAPTFPLWMYNPVLPAQLVDNLAQMNALIAENIGWTTTYIPPYVPPNSPPYNIANFLGAFGSFGFLVASYPGSQIPANQSPVAYTMDQGLAVWNAQAAQWQAAGNSMAPNQVQLGYNASVPATVTSVVYTGNAIPNGLLNLPVIVPGNAEPISISNPFSVPLILMTQNGQGINGTAATSFTMPPNSQTLVQACTNASTLYWSISLAGVSLTSAAGTEVITGSPSGTQNIEIAGMYLGAANVLAGVYTSGTLPAASANPYKFAATSDLGAFFSNGNVWQQLYNATNSTLGIATGTPLPSGANGVAYSQQLASTGGIGTVTWSLVTQYGAANTVTVSSAGVLACAAPSNNGNTACVVQAVDSTGAVAQKTLIMPIVASVSPAATPTFLPVAGSYTGPQTVAISSSTGSSTIYYTTNGTTPTLSSPSFASGGTVNVNISETLNAIADAAGSTQSAVATAAYVIAVPVATTPSISPVTGVYPGAQTVSISDTQAGVSLYYTTDGTAPTTSSTPYTAPFQVLSSTTVQAIAAATGYTNSAVATSVITISAISSAYVVQSFEIPNNGSTNGYPYNITGNFVANTTAGNTLVMFGTNSYDTHTNPASPALDMFSLNEPTNSKLSTVIDSQGDSGVGNQYQGVSYYANAPAVASSTTIEASWPANFTSGNPNTYATDWLGAIFFEIAGLTASPLLTQSAYGVVAQNVTAGKKITLPTMNLGAGTVFVIASCISDNDSGGTPYYPIPDARLSSGSVQWFRANATSTDMLGTVAWGIFTNAGNVTLSFTANPNTGISSYIAEAVSFSVNTSGNQAATPAILPVTGTYHTSPQAVTISDSTPGSTIYYTTDGTTPTTASVVYSGSFNITTTTTVKAIATAAGFTTSAVGISVITLVTVAAAAPIFSPNGGPFSSPQTVSLSSTTPGAVIYYNVGSAASPSSTEYTVPFTVNTTETIYAMCTAPGYANSPNNNATFTFGTGTLPLAPAYVSLYLQGQNSFNPATGNGSGFPTPPQPNHQTTVCAAVATATSYVCQRSNAIPPTLPFPSFASLTWTQVQSGASRTYQDTAATLCVNGTIGPNSSGLVWPGNTYLYRWAAVNGAGQGPWSDTQSAFVYLGNADSNGPGGTPAYLQEPANFSNAVTVTANDTTIGGTNAYGETLNLKIVQSGSSYWLPLSSGSFCQWNLFAVAMAIKSGGYLNFDYLPVTNANNLTMQFHRVSTESGGDTSIGPSNLSVLPKYVVAPTVGVLTPNVVNIPFSAMFTPDPSGIEQYAIYKATYQVNGGGAATYCLQRVRYAPSPGP